jgi:hypothetical protein
VDREFQVAEVLLKPVKVLLVEKAEMAVQVVFQEVQLHTLVVAVAEEANKDKVHQDPEDLVEEDQELFQELQAKLIVAAVVEVGLTHQINQVDKAVQV